MAHDRSTARRIALQGLYQIDVQGAEFANHSLPEFVYETSEEPKVRDMAIFMARGAWNFHEEVDVWLGRLAAQWPVHRMAVVDRNILRLAVWELIHYPQTPPKVVLDEAINMAKEYSTADSSAFINGILDAVLREHLAQTGKTL